jgi:hypothetical protein
VDGGKAQSMKERSPNMTLTRATRGWSRILQRRIKDKLKPMLCLQVKLKISIKCWRREKKSGTNKENWRD